MAALEYVDVELGKLRRSTYLEWRETKRHRHLWGTQARAEGAIQAIDRAREIVMNAAEWTAGERRHMRDNGS